MKKTKINKNRYLLNEERIYLPSILTTALLLIITACSDSPSSDGGNPTGSVQVQMVTIGGDDDPDGYTISVQGGVSVEIEPNGNTMIHSVPVGNQTVQISGIASHCEPTGQTSQSVAVTEGEIARVEFEVNCKAILRDKILFLRRVENTIYNIYSIDADGENMKRVSNEPLMSNANVDIAPDGLHIVFNKPGLVGSFHHIWKMNADGTGLQNLTAGLGNGTFLYPEWSPDGSKIAFSSNIFNANSDLFVMDSDGSNVTRIVGDPNIQYSFSGWSPDGSQLIIAATELITDGPNHFTLWIVNADGSGLQPFIDEGPGVILTKPQWSVDGYISFERFVQGGTTPRQIYITDINRSFENNLIAEAGYGSFPSYHASWSPDGSKVTFYTFGVGNTLNVFSAAPNGSDLKNLTNASDGIPHLSPRWSPFTRN